MLPAEGEEKKEKVEPCQVGGHYFTSDEAKACLFLVVFTIGMVTFMYAIGIIQGPPLGTDEAGKEWLAKKALEKGVVKLPSGLMYKVLKVGHDAWHHPTARSACDIHYTGKLMDGTVFDSSHERGQHNLLYPADLIEGWQEALQLMVEGDKWELYIPSELAYGDRGARHGVIPGRTVLIFEVELIKIYDKKRKKQKGKTPQAHDDEL